jgi:hypothetical protein
MIFNVIHKIRIRTSVVFRLRSCKHPLTSVPSRDTDLTVDNKQLSDENIEVSKFMRTEWRFKAIVE